MGDLQMSVVIDSRVVVRLIGELDADTAGSLAASAERLLLDGHQHLVLDCGELGFCDSYGLRALHELANGVRPDGSITLARPSRMLIRMLDITGLCDFFEFSRDHEHDVLRAPAPSE